ncbi:iron ABC transporter permease [Chitinimonas sp. BJYL2]|uniref:FecCD family ABC transporter permease n=1 Tax=Chitinimonas sp. BJYL2 TaxID=2976696 RepID=UPI0027E3F8E1|nr:iron ABC transporter permease [Chitinimonas sp. BJYL2]
MSRLLASPQTAVRLLWAGLLVLAALALLSATSGAVAIPLADLPGLLLGAPADDTGLMHHAVLVDIRLPRIVLAILAGAALAVAGCVLQAMFRNPLAEPGLIGASSGAALAAAVARVLLPGLMIAPLAFVGSLLATWLAWAIGRGQDAARLLLAGIAINALAGGGLALLSYLADETALRGGIVWALGSLSGADWATLTWLAPALILCCGALWRELGALDALLLGEREAWHLGFALGPLRQRLIALTALIVALTVAACGAIAFVGLMAPHLARIVLGPAHRLLLPGAALTGAIGLLAADWLARTVMLPSELPLGAVVSLAGAPFFLYLLISAKPRP